MTVVSVVVRTVAAGMPEVLIVAVVGALCPGVMELTGEGWSMSHPLASSCPGLVLLLFHRAAWGFGEGKIRREQSSSCSAFPVWNPDQSPGLGRVIVEVGAPG